MTGFSHLDGLDRALAAIRAWPDTPGGLDGLGDALLILEGAAAASPQADGGALHRRLMAWLCDWLRQVSPAATARRFPLPAPEPMWKRNGRAFGADHAALMGDDYRARLDHGFNLDSWSVHAPLDRDACVWASNYREWTRQALLPRPHLQMAIDILIRRSPEQLAAERSWQRWQERPGHVALHRDGSHEFIPDPGALPRGLELWDIDLQGCSFCRADLSGALLMGSQLQGCDFGFADLTGACLEQANADLAEFRGASLVGADMVELSAEAACFRDADLSRANLGSAHLPQADLTGATLLGAKLDHAMMAGTRLDEAPRIEPESLSYLLGLPVPADPVAPHPDRVLPRPLPRLGPADVAEPRPAVLH